ncbi:MAG: beta-ketoacyl-ACP synthase 3 [Solirubrobacterales bacterium]|nr:beta-ketoacyl-ACP synthase 3 [Solirubrobacterales bacterium]
MALLPETSSPTLAPPARAVRTAGVLGLGTAIPDHAVHNGEIAARLGLEPGWITHRTGIDARRRLRDGERVTDLAVLAAERALEDAGLTGADVDLVLAATTTQDELLPGMAPLVGAAIGAAGVGAMDVGAACAGFIKALVTGAAMIEAGRARTVLVVGADGLSRFTDPDDKRTAALFGDGAGAVVLSCAAAGAIGPAALGADGGAAECIVIGREDALIRMDGHETFKRAVRHLAEVTEAAVADAGLALADVDLFVYHQANRRILQSLAHRLRLDPDRVVDAIGQLGNTSAASVPLALEQARAAGDLRPGSRVLLAAIGAGLAWGAVVVEWGGA